MAVRPTTEVVLRRKQIWIAVGIAACVVLFIAVANQRESGERSEKQHRIVDAESDRNPGSLPAAEATNLSGRADSPPRTDAPRAHTKPVPAQWHDVESKPAIEGLKLLFRRSTLVHASTGSGIHPAVLADSTGPHFMVRVSRELAIAEGLDFNKAPPSVRVVDRQKRGPDEYLEARPLSRDAQSSGASAHVDGDNFAEFHYELRGLTNLPNRPHRRYRAFVSITIGNSSTYCPFRVKFRIQDPWISVGIDGRDNSWRAYATLSINEAEGIRSWSIRLFRGAKELPANWVDATLGGYPIQPQIGERTRISETKLSASAIGAKDWLSEDDLMAVFEIETLDNRRLTATWRASDRNG